MKSLESLLKSETNYMFTDTFYHNLSKKISDFYSENKNKDGFVYFIKNGAKGNKVKIGSAINIDNRVKGCQTAFHDKIFILGFIKSSDYIFLEKDVHSLFSDNRIKGEWFELNEIDIFTLKELYDYKQVNDFYDFKIPIEKMKPKEYKNKFNEITEFCKNLELNKKYTASGLLKKFKSDNPEVEIPSTSWFGREMSNSFNFLGLKKISSTSGGIRSFILK